MVIMGFTVKLIKEYSCKGWVLGEIVKIRQFSYEFVATSLQNPVIHKSFKYVFESN